jgi:hypothetical protein
MEDARGTVHPVCAVFDESPGSVSLSSLITES